nr:hypothetical protein [Actinoplanes hulinensis]
MAQRFKALGGPARTPRSTISSLASGKIATEPPGGPNAARILAADGGVFVAGSLIWRMVVDGFRPDRWDLFGAEIWPLNVGVIM